MKYEAIILALLVVILLMGSVQSCENRTERTASKGQYDSLQVKVDSLESVASVLRERIDSLERRKTVINKYYAPKIDTIRSASTMQLDSIIRTIINRHAPVYN